MKLTKKLEFLAYSGLFMLASVAAFAQTTGGYETGDSTRLSASGYAYGDPCSLVSGLWNILATLRTLAFIGAAFILAGWAWEFVTKGLDDKGTTGLEGAKKKGIGMIIGFILLFGVGMVIQFLPGTFGCDVKIENKVYTQQSQQGTEK